MDDFQYTTTLVVTAKVEFKNDTTGRDHAIVKLEKWGHSLWNTEVTDSVNYSICRHPVHDGAFTVWRVGERKDSARVIMRGGNCNCLFRRKYCLQCKHEYLADGSSFQENRCSLRVLVDGDAVAKSRLADSTIVGNGSEDSMAMSDGDYGHDEVGDDDYNHFYGGGGHLLLHSSFQGLLFAMLDSIVGLCYVLPTTGNARKQSGDQGEMHALGFREIDSKGGVVVYVPTKKINIAEAMTTATSALGIYMVKQWKSDYDDIQNAEKAKPALKVMGGISGPGRSMMISCNLANSAHLDFKDKSRSFGIWVETSPGLAKNWFFVMPDVSIDGSKGVVIRLFHGAVITWDGKEIRHCSSTPEPGEGNDVYGCMFGAVA
jgi:hypothetical protein